jgi:HAD superfamily hydrolase (TIGR01490 family)
MTHKIALFDLDHTLLPIDSDHGWGQFTIRLGWVDADEMTKGNAAFYQDYLAGRLDIHAYVRFATQAIRLQGSEAAQRAHLQYMQEVIEPAITPEALDLIDRHRQEGCRLVLVTASNEFVTAPIAQRLGMDHLIAVQLERDAQGELTGGISGVPSYREGKVERVAQWLQGLGQSLDSVKTYFYSDSMNDLPLLERVQHPVATNPDPRLRALAAERGWPILELFKTTHP